MQALALVVVSLNNGDANARKAYVRGKLFEPQRHLSIQMSMREYVERKTFEPQRHLSPYIEKPMN